MSDLISRLPLALPQPLLKHTAPQAKLSIRAILTCWDFQRFKPESSVCLLWALIPQWMGVTPSQWATTPKQHAEPSLLVFHLSTTLIRNHPACRSTQCSECTPPGSSLASCCLTQASRWFCSVSNLGVGLKLLSGDSESVCSPHLSFQDLLSMPFF